MPKIDMTVEPIVSSRQITYTLILRQIENRIKEVIAESLVYPNWDDSPFYETIEKIWRGGIWADDRPTKPQDAESEAAQKGNVDKVQHFEAEQHEAIEALPEMEKSFSMPLVDTSPAGTPYPRKSGKSNLGISASHGSSTSVEAQPFDRPRGLRSGSFASLPPVIGTNSTTADAFEEPSGKVNNHAMEVVAALSQAHSPVHTPNGSPSRTVRMERNGSISSVSSQSLSLEKGSENDLTPQPTALHTTDVHVGLKSTSYPPSPSSISNASFKSDAKSFGSFTPFGSEIGRENSTSSGKSSSPESKRISLAAVTNAAVTAKKWGWNALQRHADSKSGSADMTENSQPIVIGAGRPLPPPGTPLPPPDRKTKTAPIPVPLKRKLVPPPPAPIRQDHSSNVSHNQRAIVSPPNLPLGGKQPSFHTSNSKMSRDE